MKETALFLSSARKLTFSALFAALCCVGTLVIVIPLPVGYFNAGDVFVLLSGWCLGPIYGVLAAGLGSALADVIGGFPVYALATFFIKALDALVAYYAYSALKTLIKKPFARTLSAFFGECCMVLGYFLFEIVLYGIAPACGALLGNSLQGIFGAICAVLLVFALRKAKAYKIFPKLDE